MVTTLSKMIGLAALGAALLAPMPAGAKDIFRSDMTLTKGVDPSMSALCIATGVGRWDGTTVRVSLGDLDPVRFPANAGCKTQVKIGKLLVKGTLLVLGPADCDPNLTTTSLDFRMTKVIKAGIKFSASVSCVVAGHTYSTTWSGIF